MDASELKRVKELKQQLSEYKTMVAELTHDNRALKNLIEKTLAPTGKSYAVDCPVGEEAVPITRAFAQLKLAKSFYYTRPAGKAKAEEPVIEVLNQAVSKHGRWGFRLCFDWMCNQGAMPGITNGYGGCIKRWA